MKKILITICTVFLMIAAPVSAFEWGGLISNDTGIQTPDFKNITLNQADGVSLWFNTPIGADFALSGEVLYKFKLSKAGSANAVITNIADLPLLKFSGQTQAGSGKLSVSAGRFAYVDNAGAVVSGTIDGASVDYAFSVVDIGLFAGSSGLLNTLNNPSLERADYTKEANIYDMAYAYAPVGLSFELPYLFGNQSLSIQAYALLDCGKHETKSNNFYANLALSGPITNTVYYNLASSAGLIDFKKFMNYSGFTLLVFPAQTVSINAGAEFTTADDGKLAAFYSPLAAKTGGQLAPKLGFTFGTDDMCFDLGGKYILQYANSSYAGYGAEINSSFIYNIFSDLQVGLSFNGFIDTTADKLEGNRFTANLNIALAF